MFDTVYPLLRNGLGSAHGQQYDIKVFCQNVSRFISLDMAQIKEMFFYHVLDRNKDKLVCETDLFRIMRELKNDCISGMISDDIVILLQHMQQIRSTRGLADEIKLKAD